MNASIAESFSTRSLDFETLLELSHRSDPVGVLSIYLDARPGGPLRASLIDLGNRLTKLERRLDSYASPDRAQAVGVGLARVAEQIERLSEPDTLGRGRILFAALSEGWVTRLATQLPVRNRVVLAESPFIHPLLELLDEGAPAGVVIGSRTQARLLEWRLGELAQLRELRAELSEPPHERSGPVGSQPGALHGTPTGEQRNARQRDQANRFAERTAADIARLARERGWGRILLSAGEQVTDALVRALPPELRKIAIRDPRMLVRLDIATLEELVTERLRADHHESERTLIAGLRGRAGGADAAALGLSEVVGALNQARVARLVYDPEIRYRGSVGHDGTLYADGESALAYSSTPDLRLTERIVERALETGARVTPVEGAARDGLADAAGIAAVLRW